MSRPPFLGSGHMNGFVIFDRADSLTNFLDALKELPVQPHQRFVKSPQQHLILFREVSADELSIIRDIANRYDGRVIESTKYYPM
jgi:hypothetical protein